MILHYIFNITARICKRNLKAFFSSNCHS